jgi:hypothetical protein
MAVHMSVVAKRSGGGDGTSQELPRLSPTSPGFAPPAEDIEET